MALFQNYDIEDILAEGDVATVYKCIQASPHRPVAVKVLSQNWTNRHPEIAKHLEQVFVYVARLNHAHIVRLLDGGLVSGLPYYVSEYVDGRRLDAVMREGALDFRGKLGVVVQICKALAYAHRNGIIHGRIKPANLLFDHAGNIRITDFGISQLVYPDHRDSATGALEYLAPEQRNGVADLTPAADIYALGVVIYQLFTKQLPAEPLTYPSYHDATIPAYLDEIVTTCLKEDPVRRYTDGQMVRDKLLDVMYGAHLEEGKKNEVLKDMGDIMTRFAVLDVVKEDRYGAVFFCMNTVNHNHVMVKKVARSVKGFQECMLLANLKHPNLVKIYGTSKEKYLYIIMMEYLSGGSLKERLVHPWEWPLAVTTARDICRGLAFLQKNNLVHGNLRPSNVLFDKDGAARISDCCLQEHYLEQDGKANVYAYANEARTDLSDVYSVGAILFEMLTGTVPVWNRNQLVVNGKFRSLPAVLQDMVHRMLAPVPKDRYRSFSEIEHKLDVLLNTGAPEHVRQRRRSWSEMLLMFLAALFLAVLFVLVLVFPDIAGAVIDTWRGWFGID